MTQFFFHVYFKKFTQTQSSSTGEDCGSVHFWSFTTHNNNGSSSIVESRLLFLRPRQFLCAERSSSCSGSSGGRRLKNNKNIFINLNKNTKERKKLSNGCLYSRGRKQIFAKHHLATHYIPSSPVERLSSRRRTSLGTRLF